MRSLMLFLAALPIAAAADDSWSKVRELKSGTEIRVVKKGSAVPLLAKSADATGDKLIVIVKNAEIAIDRNEIERIDARPSNRRPATGHQADQRKHQRPATADEGSAPRGFAGSKLLLFDECGHRFEARF